MTTIANTERAYTNGRDCKGVDWLQGILLCIPLFKCCADCCIRKDSHTGRACDKTSESINNQVLKTFMSIDKM